MQITENIKVLLITVNSSDIGIDGITDIGFPNEESPYWEFLYDNGHRVYATGMVCVDLRYQ